ncbi:hypothetical protein, partial [Xanthomonas hortorum]|uniref:hypothetical protein n=1 Tax=Xanthomonas hortorum TaxID=56454 RepID=UPI0020439F21
MIITHTHRSFCTLAVGDAGRQNGRSRKQPARLPGFSRGYLTAGRCANSAKVARLVRQGEALPCVDPIPPKPARKRATVP